jgi:hypothetical protein
MKARIDPQTSMLQEFFNSLDRLRNALDDGSALSQPNSFDTLVAEFYDEPSPCLAVEINGLHL